MLCREKKEFKKTFRIFTKRLRTNQKNIEHPRLAISKLPNNTEFLFQLEFASITFSDVSVRKDWRLFSEMFRVKKISGTNYVIAIF